MAKPILKSVTESKTAGSGVPVRIVEFEIPGGVTSPPEFAEFTTELAPELPGKTAVFFTGRGPIWAYGMLLHAAHPTPATGTYDPRIGFTVVATHDENFKLGEVIPEFKESPAPAVT